MFRDRRRKWVACKCPVCHSILGYRDKSDLVHFYCDACDWTFRFNRHGRILSKHKGRMQWSDYPPYLKETSSEADEAPPSK